jgi:hypothetical protein
MAQVLVEVLEDVDAVVAYDAGFVKKCLDDMAASAPDFAAHLKVVASKLHDLLPVVRNHVYHSEFLGSFDLGPVLSALAPDLMDESPDLPREQSAEALLHTLLFEGEPEEPDQRETLRREIMDRFAASSLSMLRLKQWLEDKAEPQEKGSKAS